jgi:hypothetical protein
MSFIIAIERRRVGAVVKEVSRVEGSKERLDWGIKALVELLANLLGEAISKKVKIVD